VGGSKSFDHLVSEGCGFVEQAGHGGAPGPN
jgi:hypothetical protein